MKKITTSILIVLALIGILSLLGVVIAQNPSQIFGQDVVFNLSSGHGYFGRVCIGNETPLDLDQRLIVVGDANITGDLFSKGVNITAGGADNASWNQTLANSLYADISVTGDNSSWNESHANTLYLTSYTENDPHWTSNQTLFPLNVSFNSSQFTTTSNMTISETWLDGLFATISEALLVVSGFFDQDLNTTSSPTFVNITANNVTADLFFGNGSQLAGLTLTETDPQWLLNLTAHNASWSSIYNATYDSHTQDNASWNQTLADGLYAASGSGNASWNQTLANSLYSLITEPLWTANQSNYYTITQADNADNDTTYSSLSEFSDDLGDRGYTSNLNFTNDVNYWNDTQATFNKTYADTLYAASGSGNASWNESHANTLYLTSYTETDPQWLSNLTANNDTWTSTYNSTYDAKVSDNSSWNQTLANSLYAPTGSGNASWNESHANTLYYDISANVLNYWNSTFATFNKTYADTLYDPLGGSESDPLWTANYSAHNDSWSSIYNATYDAYNSSGWIIDWNSTGLIINWTTIISGGGNASWNQTLANSLYADISVTGDNSSWNETHANTLYLTSYTETDPHWSSNQSSYYTSTQVDGFEFYNSTRLNSTQFNQSSTSVLNILESFISGLFDSFLGTKDTDDLSQGSTNFYDNQSWNETHANTLYSGSGNASWNETLANTLYYDISANVLSYWNSTYATFNKTYADTLYYDIDDNVLSYWNSTHALFNKTYADTLYSGGNASWNETLANTLYYDISANTLAYWNSTYALFNKTYADTLYYDVDDNVLNYWNSTFATFNKTYADTLYYDIDNNVLSYWNDTQATFNKTYADTLYSTIAEPLWTANLTNVAFTNTIETFAENVTFSKNITVTDCIIFNSGGTFCSS
jgi:hypothetical protein